MKLFAGRGQKLRHREQTYGHGETERVGQTEETVPKYTQHHVYNRELMGKCRTAQAAGLVHP